MKEICLLVLSFMIISSCNSQNKTDLPKDKTIKEQNKSNTIPFDRKEIITPPDDPYFVETRDTVSKYGPHSITRNILQDRNGNMWFATWEGIIRYDGKQFTNYTLKDGLRHFHVFSVLEDKKGNIWFGTIRGGVYRYNPSIDNEQNSQGKSFTLFLQSDGLAGNLITSMLEDNYGNIWFGTDDGVSSFDGNTFINFTTEQGLSSNSVYSIAQDKTGKLWFGTNGGVNIYDPSPHSHSNTQLTGGKSITSFTNKKEGTSFHNVRSIITDKSGIIWIGSQEGLCRYDPISGEITNISKNFIGNIFEDKSGKLWLSMGNINGHGMTLTQYDPGSGELVNVFARNVSPEPFFNQVFGTTEDRDGNIWFGTVDGVCRYNRKLNVTTVNPGSNEKLYTEFSEKATK